MAVPSVVLTIAPDVQTDRVFPFSVTVNVTNPPSGTGATVAVRVRGEPTVPFGAETETVEVGAGAPEAFWR